MGAAGCFDELLPGLVPVGRERLLTEFRAGLHDSTAGGPRYLHGPGGVGKTTLMRAMQGLARAAGFGEAWVDLQGVAVSADAVQQALHAAPGVFSGQPTLLFLDGFEAHARLEPWYRRRLVRSLPGSVRLVFAGRRALQRGWISGAAAIAGLAVQRLSPLGVDASRFLLRDAPEPLASQLLAVCAGLPSALVEAALQIRDGLRSPLALTDRIYASAAGCIEPAPSPQHLEALRICALTPGLDRRLLSAALDCPEAARLHDWLSTLSVVRDSELGLVMEPLFAQALRRDHQLSLPEAYAARSLQLGRLLSERLTRADRPETRASAIEGLLHLAHDPVDAPPVPVRVEVCDAERARAAWSEHGSIEAPGFGDGAASYHMVRDADGQLLGCVVAHDPYAAGAGGFESPALVGARAWLQTSAVSRAERVRVFEPYLLPGSVAHGAAGRAVFHATARALHCDRRLTVGIVATNPRDELEPSFRNQLGMLEPLPARGEGSPSDLHRFWYCDHARRSASACLYSQLRARHLPRGQRVVV